MGRINPTVIELKQCAARLHGNPIRIVMFDIFIIPMDKAFWMNYWTAIFQKIEKKIGSWATETEKKTTTQFDAKQYETSTNMNARASVYVCLCVYSLWAMTSTHTLHMIAICNFLAIKIDKILVLWLIVKPYRTWHVFFLFMLYFYDRQFFLLGKCYKCFFVFFSSTIRDLNIS